MINRNPIELTPKLWVEIIVFLSAYYPLFLILFIQDINTKTKGITFGLSSWQLNVSWPALLLLSLSSVSVLLIAPLMRSLLISQQGATEIKILSAEHIRGDMLNYTLPFLIGLFGFNYNSWQSIVSLIIFLTFMFSFVHKEQLSLLNPMFLIMGIRLYRVTYKEVGRETEFDKAVLCLGELSVSMEILEIKKTAGIHFLFPKG